MPGWMRGMWVGLAACGGAPRQVAEPPVCASSGAWDGERALFRDASADWGLPELAPVGVRLNAVDFDHDGWTDLAVRAGTTPDDFAAGVRSTWLLRNTGDGRFEDVTEASGILARRSGGPLGRPGPVWVWADVDNDGDLDVFTGLPDAGSGDQEASEILLNDGKGRFELAAESPWRGDEEQPFGAAFTDYDRDGRVDLWLAHYAGTEGSPQQDHLWRGQGDGTFVKVTAEAGLKTQEWGDVEVLNRGRAHSQAWAAAACDLNNDGWPELLASSYGRAPNHLWRNDGGRFVNESVASGYAFDHREDWSDNESARCWCLLLPDAEDCAGVPPPSAIACDSLDDAFRWNHTFDREAYRLGGNSGATTCADVDNDGWFDLLTSEIVHWDVGSSSDPSELLFNLGDPEIRFERPGNEATGLTRQRDLLDWNDGDITGTLVDVDNDGWLDVYVGSSDYPDTHGLLWRQVEPRRFERVPARLGVDHPRSHGVVAADFDRDGDLDLVVGHSSARCDEDCYSPPTVRLLENTTADDGHSNWIQLRLQGTAGSNRAAIGARVSVRAEGLTLTRQVGGGHGQWGSQDDLVQHFGLGGACAVEVEVVWPDAAGTVERHQLVAGARYHLVQGVPVAGLLEEGE